MQALDERDGVLSRAAVRGGDGGQHGEADRAPDLVEGGEQPAGEALVDVRHAGGAADRGGGVGDTQSDREQRHAGQHVGQVAAVDRDAAEQQRGDDQRGESGDEQRPDAERPGEAGGQRRRGHDHQGHREKGQTRPGG